MTSLDDLSLRCRAAGGEPDLAASLAAAQAGDENAFRVLYRALQPGMLRYLRVLVGEDAEDVASEAWLQIANGLSGFRGDIDGFRGWTATIARNRALDQLRSRRRRPLTTDAELLVEFPARDNTADSAVDTLSTDAALALIAKLPPDQAEAVLLRAVVGLDAAGAAKVLGKRSGAVRTAAYRGLRKLAEHLEQAGVTDPGALTLNEMR
ncbi:RNA polymerase sigma factor [Amycolatopsis pithecellobii]|uniref:RNA polymerase sigma factor n=1 Tax=Amycolatopsis pithecellobii TaxID=664692 RepID=UPI0028AA3734|nr:RNA polymerase sigma factor [Amycolatopsis pithecellobii]